MAETISRDDSGLDVDEGVPPPEEATAAPTPAPPPAAAPGGTNVRRNTMIGAATGFLVTASMVTVGFVLTGMAATSALGLAVFVAGWGGAAFGFMLTAAISLADHTGPVPAVRPVPATEVPA